MSNSQAVAYDGLRLTGTIKSIAIAISQPRMPSNAVMVAQLKNIANPPLYDYSQFTSLGI